MINEANNYATRNWQSERNWYGMKLNGTSYGSLQLADLFDICLAI